MSEILSYFFNPEESMSGLLIEENKNKWKDGLKYGVMITVLLGFLTMAVYRISGIPIADVIGSSLEKVISGLVGTNTHEGFAWLVLALVSIVQTLFIVMIKFLVWAAMLYLASSILGERISIYEAVLISMFSVVVWVAAQLISVIVILIISIMPLQVINQILLGLSMILNYWYLILMAIGFTIATKSTFLKGSLAVLVIQGVFWALGSVFPILQTILG